MKWYLISYEGNGADYSGLHGFLERWGAIRVLESLWITGHAADAITIRDTLGNVVPPTTSLVVIEITKDANWATGHVHRDAVEALQKASPPV